MIIPRPGDGGRVQPWPGRDRDGDRRRDPVRRPPVVRRPPSHRPPVLRPDPIRRPDGRHGRAVPRPRPGIDQRDLFRDRVFVRHPDRWRDGSPLRYRHLDRHPDHSVIFNNTVIIGNIHSHNRGELLRNHYYWHEHGGTRYCHTYDGSWHWYGFYVGPTYYWTRWDNGYFWWYDAHRSRWCYWNQGHWWWHDPYDVRVVYVYIGDGYQRWRETPSSVVLEPEKPATPAPAPAPEEQAYYSKDDTRLVQIVGERKEAFLYDLTQEASDGKPQFVAYLGAGVTEVRFSNTDGGKPLEILVVLADGTFSLFDAQGAGIGGNAPPPAPEAPETAPAPGLPEGALAPGAPPSAQGLQEAASSGKFGD